MRQVIRLTERDLHRLVMESARRVMLSEAAEPTHDIATIGANSAEQAIKLIRPKYARYIRSQENPEGFLLKHKFLARRDKGGWTVYYEGRLPRGFEFRTTDRHGNGDWTVERRPRHPRQPEQPAEQAPVDQPINDNPPEEAEVEDVEVDNNLPRIATDIDMSEVQQQFPGEEFLPLEFGSPNNPNATDEVREIIRNKYLLSQHGLLYNKETRVLVKSYQHGIGEAIDFTAETDMGRFHFNTTVRSLIHNTFSRRY